MDIKKLIKLQNAIIRAHQKIKEVQNSNDNQTKEIKNEFKKEVDNLNKTLERLSKELNSFIKKEELNSQNEELGRLKRTLDELNNSLDKRISEIQLTPGKDGKDGLNGMPGKDGKPGKDGRDGKDGCNGKDGANGLSAYEIAVKQGFKGTEEEWINRITNSGGKNYTRQLTAINERINKLYEVPETVYASGADFGEYFEWYDGNPNNEDRTGYFVTLHEDTGKIKIANSEDDILGITTDSEAFIGNYGKDKIDNLKYAIVGLIGVVSVRECENVRCTVGGYCMPNEYGMATGTDKLGYQVVKRENEDYVQVMLNCGSDMIHRLNNKSGGSYTADDNIVIENDVIKGYTNTGYIVSDTDIKLQAISEVETTAETVDNKIVYTYDEVVIIYDGTNYIRRSENGIDFEVIELPYACKNMIFHSVSKRLIATNCNGYFMYSDDNGKTWAVQASSFATSNTYLFQQNTFSNGFAVINISTKKIITLNENFSANNTLTSTIVPNYTCLLNSSQFIWCNNIGGFKYGAGAKEGVFPSLVGVSVSLLKNVNDKIIVGLNNNNKLYILSQNTVSGSSWVAYNLPKQCTVNDIIYNFNDNTYYILTSINTYYKTTDFVNFVSVDKDNLRGIQGYFTLAGIQATTADNNKLLLAPTRIKIENMLQKFKRLTDFDKLLDVGLEKKSEETIGVKVRAPIYVSTSGVSLSGRSVDYNYLTEEIEKILKVSEAPITALSPTEIEDYVWSNWDGTDNFAFKFMFTEAGTFYNVMSYEEEYTVEKYELGYIYIINNGMTAPYTSMGKFGVFFQ